MRILNGDFDERNNVHKQVFMQAFDKFSLTG